MRKHLVTGAAVLACVALLGTAVPAAAQRGRPGPGFRPARPHISIGAYFGPYYGPYYYSPWFYNSFWLYGPGPHGYPYFYGGSGAASVRVQVQPKQAQVYVDGSFAGIVDQFDGFFQRLEVEPGSHDITVYLDGYRSIVQHLYLSPGVTYRVKGLLEPLAAGEPAEPRPQPAVPPRLQQGAPREVPPSASWPRDRAPRDTPPPDDRQAPLPDADRPAPPVERDAVEPTAADARFGQIAIRVQPADAQVLIDGEVWRAPEGAERIVVYVKAGTHRVEIRKDGFDTFVTAVEVRRGEVAAVNVSLARL